ncbi:hypothetical protein [uncultured Corynebacterium sp.]|uniref:hypothetical protein n=1 Tax=uncultured Corynebacterium sp. TaxID=159447 RepID=UPI00260D7479|nr:hypothetical protein [uncultured Corynebacterium sp.]
MTNKQRLEELKQQAKELANQIDQLEDQINNAQPTTGLLGRWAKHPKLGDVLIAEDKPTHKGLIHVSYLSGDAIGGAQGNFVLIDDLTFPKQTTRPQDVPVGEAWLVDAHNGFDSQPNTPALKIAPGLWVTPAREAADESEWHNYEITLITPLIPARQHDTPETVTTQEEYGELPEGSVVAKPGEKPWVHLPHVWVQEGATTNDLVMARTTRHVLRRGWGK